MRTAEHMSRLWVTLLCKSRSELLMRVSLGCELLSAVWASLNHWWELLNTCPGCESLFSFWAQNHWREWLTTHPGCESSSGLCGDMNHWQGWLAHVQLVSCSPVFEQIGTTDENDWTCVQDVSCFPVQTRITDKYTSRLWVPLQYLNRSKLLMRMAEPASSECVALPCLSRLEPLTRTTGHASRMWVAVRADQNYWWEWLNMHPACESIFSVWTDQIHWQKLLIMHPVCESLSSVWADQYHYQEWLNMCPGCELLFEQNRASNLNEYAEYVSRLWVALQFLCRSEPLRMAELVSRKWVSLQCLRISVLMRMAEHASSEWVTLHWREQNYWWEYLNTHPASELISSVWVDLDWNY